MARKKLFTKQLRMWFSRHQDDWLDAEVKRRLKIKDKHGPAASLEGLHPAAVGENASINKGMLLRDALERTHNITPATE